MIQIHCAKTVPESNVFNPFELSLSEKQIPRFVGNISSLKKWTELLESSAVRPRLARYQAALRPDKNCSIILKHYRTLLQRGSALLLAAVHE